MFLQDALSKAQSVTDLSDIFNNNVRVSLGWNNDVVSVDGYGGTITTDMIAHKIASLCNSIKEDSKESKELARSLANKVFIPLKVLVESPENQCALYQFIALTRIGWTPPQSPVFGNTIALKHAMSLGFLSSEYRVGW